MDSRIEIINLLTQLLSFEVESKADLKSWYELANTVEELATNTSVELPHIVWHYLSDADVRLKEPGYGKEQIAGVQSFIELLRTGTTNA